MEADDDKELIASIAPDVMRCLVRSGFFEKLDILQEDWVNGRISPLQRARCVAMDYATKMRMSEMGYADDEGSSPESWKASAAKLAQFEKIRLGVDVAHASHEKRNIDSE